MIGLNQEGDLLTMDMDYLKRQEQESLLRRRVLQAEKERLEEAETMSISEARDGLRERITYVEQSDRNSSKGSYRTS